MNSLRGSYKKGAYNFSKIKNKKKKKKKEKQEKRKPISPRLGRRLNFRLSTRRYPIIFES